ncbi:hypothetical protein SAMN05192561_11534 [Halopenitus malekzadehii]|uniref:Uncharacterized protein n=1 Tax=Halopenitus malekzadehii TaxID=1267564 RepID=A0A1H6JUK5_9EURY|nr:hypothetical protein [Halopenitus malekzadehii]SEH62949.1 hypothetical protein SAMN05192561_11534 [Halopenitus malekzadehii]
MPRLKRYVESSEQDGYYVLAHTGQPVTLQVSDLGYVIFHFLGYSPNEGLPSKLVWAMYDIDILYSSSSVDLERENQNISQLIEVLDDLDLDKEFGAEDRRRLVEYLKNYEGPDKEDVQEFIERIGLSDDIEIPGKSPNPIPTNFKEALSLIERHASSRSDFETSVSRIHDQNYTKASIQSFANHPHLVEESIEVRPHGVIQYELSRDRKGETIIVRDKRITEDDPYDYSIRIKYSTGGKEIATVKDGYLQEYHNHDASVGARFRISSMLDWILPTTEVEFTRESEETEVGSGYVSEWNGMELIPINVVQHPDPSDLKIFAVDRISNAGNPVVETEDGILLLDEGEPDERYLVKVKSDHNGEVISRVKE